MPAVIRDSRMWKSLGHIGSGLEARYMIDSFDGELDSDREAELREQVRSLVPTITACDNWPGVPYLNPYSRRPQLVCLLPISIDRPSARLPH